MKKSYRIPKIPEGMELRLNQGTRICPFCNEKTHAQISDSSMEKWDWYCGICQKKIIDMIRKIHPFSDSCMCSFCRPEIHVKKGGVPMIRSIEWHEEQVVKMEQAMKDETRSYQAFELERNSVFYREQIWMAKHKGMKEFDAGSFLRKNR